jgi:hypothetical protein
MQLQRLTCAAAAALMLSACGGGLQNALPPGRQAPSAARTQKHAKAKLEFRLKIPRRRKHHRGPRYVSPSTQSIAVLQGTKSLGTFNTSASSANCSDVNGGTMCTFTVGIASGKNQVFRVNAYDRPNGAGNLLSSGTVIQTIKPGFNVIPITLSGVVSSIAVGVQNPNTPAGTRATLAVSVMAEDADGNVIVGPGAYSTPIALTDSDTSGATTLSATTVSGPNGKVTLTYSGANLTSATIGASATGISPSNIAPATFAPAPTVVGNFSLPMTVGGVTDSWDSDTIANGPDGNLWFGSGGTGSNYALFKMTPSGTMTPFVPGTAPSTNLPNNLIHALTAGSDGKMWYAGYSSVGNVTTGGAATDYPLSGIAGACAGINDPGGIVPAADGGLWFTVNCSSGSELIHVSTAGVFTPNQLPSATFGGAEQLLVGKDGHVYVAGYDNTTSKPAILQAVVSGGTVSSSSVVDVSNAGTSGLYGIAQSTDGDLWATSTSCQYSLLVRVHLAAAFGSSTVSTFPTLSGCADPAGIVALPDGSLWVAEDDYAIATQIIPAPNEGTPALFDLPLPTPASVYGYIFSVAVGSDGALYFTNDSHGQSTMVIPSNVIKVAY